MDLSFERAPRLTRAEQVENGTFVQEWPEEGDTLNVIPVEVADKGGGVQRLIDPGPFPASDKVITEVPQPGAEITDDGLLTVDLDEHTGGIAPEIASGITTARCRTSHPVEGDAQHRLTPGPGSKSITIHLTATPAKKEFQQSSTHDTNQDNGCELCLTGLPVQTRSTSALFAPPNEVDEARATTKI